MPKRKQAGGERVTTADLKAALASRYAGEAWSLFWEVPDGTGRDKERTADAVAMSLWPSRGLRLHGHELKASRSDWLKELSQPQKAESICRFCDHWWIVAAPDVVKDGELPPTWGLLVLRGSQLTTIVHAPDLTAQPIDRQFLAGLCRASTKSIAKEDTRVLRAEYQRGFDAGMKNSKHGESHYKECLDQLTANVRAFEEQSGVSISRFGTDPAMASLVKAVVSGERCDRHARQMAGEIYRAANGMLRTLENHGLMPAGK